MKMKKLLTTLCLTLISCAGPVDFTADDFPIPVGVDCVTTGETFCRYTQQAIWQFNAQAGVDVFELVKNTEQVIQITTGESTLKTSVTGKTFHDIGFVSIEIFNVAGRNPACVIQHHLGHALGLHEHINDTANLMSSTPSCYTQDIGANGWDDYFQPFADWFYDTFYPEQ